MRLTTLKTYAFLLTGLFTIVASCQVKTVKGIKKFGKQPFNTIIRCATTEYETLLENKNPARPAKNQFENWLAPKVNAARTKRLSKMDNEPGVLTIPIVFHIIHSGLPVGVQENIAEGQILSQITVLNEDFRRLVNTPGFNNNPVGADTGIQFCLAKQDPNGVLTTGINRYALGNENGFTMEEVEILKTQTQWDPERYLNIWVVKSIYIADDFEVGGYAQFPVASGLDGFDDLGGATAADTDGVMIIYRCIGSEDLYPQGVYSEYRSKGRSATHEIGHFLGLRHIWGDEDGCTGTDYCADTPTAETANSYCPEGLDSCPSPGSDMIENYMDYTGDYCMNVFTLDQKDRMMAVLENSPRRASLLTSDVCTPGETYDNDGSINIHSLNESCGTAFAPQVNLINTGTNAITTASISYHIDADAAAIYNWTGNLLHGESAIIELPALAASAGTHNFTVNLLTINNTQDDAQGNNSDNAQFVTDSYPTFNSSSVTVTIQTDDFGEETLWALATFDQEIIFANFDTENPSETGTYESNQSYTYTFDVADNTCYMFVIIDTFGDGICCENGEGNYIITASDGAVIAQGGQFGEYMEHAFAIGSDLGANKATAANSIKLYPNPANTVVNIVMPQAQGAYTVYNSIGQVINQDNATAANFSLDVSNYSNGIYFIKVETAFGSETLRFIKN